MIDKSISFGIQNFLFLTIDETDLTYNYVAYMTRKGSVLLARFTKTYNEALYWLGNGTFSTIWADRTGKTYALPSTLIDPTV
jgi:hypothetical protein